MASPVLATKLYIPPPPLKVVVRTRLIERINKRLAEGSKLTIISAPAGFGKTTLVSEWIADGRQPAAWLSLEEGDSDPVRFFTYFVAALQTVAPNVGEEMLSTLQASQSQPPIEPILTTLLNEMMSVPDRITLVLDDYHSIDSRAVDTALAFFIEHLPPRTHLVITTREDPALPIARLRARGQLTELRAADLRFTPSEAAEFLNQMMSLGLSAEDVTALETRTEGWIAGLQLAALSIKGHQDVTGFIQAFAGDNRYIVDYLVEEVLQSQPGPIRSFLLQTSILDRLDGTLCDAVTSQPGSSAKLESLQKGNFFLIPLDDRRHWFRYHHLFADVLRMHLLAEQPDQVSILHRRASEWYEQNGLTADAIHHALRAGDFDRAADLIEWAIPEMGRSRQESTLLGWLKALPDEVLQVRPVLSVHYVGALLQNGQLDGVEERLRDAERWLAMSADLRERPIYVDEKEFRRLPGLVAMYHAGIALVRGAVTDTIKYAKRVLELARENDSFLRGAASALLGLAFWTSGDLETARQTYTDGMAHLQRIGFLSDAIGGRVYLADIRITQGRLHEAMRIYEQGLQLAREHGTPMMRGTADMYVGLSELARERNNPSAAMQHLLKSKAQGEHTGFPQYPYRWRVAMARLQEVQGNPDGALDLLDEAESLYLSDFSPNVRPIPALKARVWVRQGRLEKALDWARERKSSMEESPSYLREFEQITFARVLLEQYKSNGSETLINEAIDLLKRLLKAAEEGGRMGSAIEILILQALAHQMQETRPAALPSLERALKLAEPEGYMRMFVDEGPAMATLLRKAATNRITPDYAAKLLLALEAEQKEVEEEPPRSASPASPSLIEPLSQRELDILRLFKTELSGPEIAQELVIALSTVRTHTKSIYSKLNVNNRRAAVKRAMELGLI